MLSFAAVPFIQRTNTFRRVMWLLAVMSLPALVLVSTRQRAKLTALWHRVFSWALKVSRRRVCVKSTHAFVFSNCTHGKAHSVLATFDLYATSHPSLAIGPLTGEVLDVVMRGVAPLRVLELGTHCGYASIRLLALLPPAGRLLTVEIDPVTSELAEELILVAGFKHTQFQILTCSSAEAIPALGLHLGLENGSGLGLDLVLMDHDPQQYLPDLLALERAGVLRSGCVLLLHGQGSCSLGTLQEHLQARPEIYFIQGESQGLLEATYHSDGLR